MADDGRTVHWSFWLIGAVTLLYNLAGVMNFIAQMSTENIAAMPEGYRMIVETRPLWATAAFALAVFSGALGCALLLLKKSAAFYVFAASLIGALLTMGHALSTDSPPAFLIGNLMQIAVTVILVWYARLTNRKGWLAPS